MRPFVMVVVMAACSPAAHQASARWPHHREHQDQRIEQLEAHVTALEHQVAELERRLATVQATPAP